MLTRRKLLLCEIESTYNTDPTPVAADDSVLVENITWASAGLRMIARPANRPSLAELPQVFGGRLLQVTFDVEIKGSGAAGTAPEFGKLLRACGLGETIVASTSVTYAPVSTGFESVTLYLYEDGKRIILTGCRGTVSFAATSGERIVASFTMTGHEAAQTDVALATPTYDSTEPPPFNGASFTVDSFSATIGALNFDLANSIAMPPDANSSDGYGEIQITGRDINGSIDPEDELVATEDFLGNFKAGSDMALATGVLGSTAGNRVAITMPAVRYRDASLSDRDGIAALQMPFGAGESTTDDELSIAFT